MYDLLFDRKDYRVWQKKYEPAAPKAGDLAPDFVLRDGKAENPVQLSGFRDKQPVALVFGSFT